MPGPNRPWLDKYIFIGLLILFGGTYVALHLVASYDFPTPWVDEAHFLWQAKAFADNFSLFAPQLNPDRSIFWQPPGYFILTGLWFKLFGVSLASARSLSLVSMLGFFVMLALIIRNYSRSIVSIALMGLFFLNVRFIAAGNIARMESVILLFAGVGFYLIQRRKFALGLSLLALSPLIHFNGFWFLAGGIVFALLEHGQPTIKESLHKKTLSLLAAPVAAWLAYAVYAVANWTYFETDMAMQFARKGIRDKLGFITQPEHLLIFILVLIGIVYSRREGLKVIRLLALAIPAWLAWAYGQEVWYQLFQHLAVLIISVILVEIFFHIISSGIEIKSRLLRASTALLFLIVLVGWNVRNDMIEDYFDYPAAATFNTMNLFGAEKYADGSDLDQIASLLNSATPNHDSITVEMQPNADAFLVLDKVDSRIKFSQPLFCSRVPDVYLVHTSANLPTWWKFTTRILNRYGVNPGSDDYVVHQRSHTDKWYCIVTNPNIRLAAEIPYPDTALAIP